MSRTKKVLQQAERFHSRLQVCRTTPVSGRRVEAAGGA